MAQLNPYLMFNGNCRAAMTFYQTCLGGELAVQTYGESPMAEHTPPALHDRVLHAALNKDGAVLLFASDMMGGAGAEQGNTVMLCLNCTSEEEIQGVFAKLAAGGQVGRALETTFWGATFGDLTDQYGMRWMLNYDRQQNR